MLTKQDLNLIIISAFIGLTIGNFFWQVITTQEWSIALEKSIFQWSALLAVWIIAKVVSRISVH